MANQQHFDMATLGVRANHKVLALSGVGFGFQIIVTVDTSSGGGGSGPLPRREYRRELKNLFSLIQIKFFGREENFLFYTRATIDGVTVEVKLVRVEKVKDNTSVKAVLNKIMKIVQKPIIKIKGML